MVYQLGVSGFSRQKACKAPLRPCIRERVMDPENSLLRPLLFILLLVLFAVAEALFPRRPKTQSQTRRWFSNLGLLVIGAVAARWLLPIVPVGAALWAADQGIGLFNSAPIPLWISGILAFLALDLLIYAQHRLFHHVPLLWRLHRMHHTDLDLDVSSGIRFHPLEILLSLALKIGAVAALGASPIAVLVFEIALNGTSMFNHANIALPRSVDSVLRLAVVTPDMHRIHHSIHRDETDSNFGFNIPWWDRLLGTYKAEPKDGQTGLTLGLPIFRDDRAIRLLPLLTQPFVDEKASHLKPKEKGDEDNSPPSRHD